MGSTQERSIIYDNGAYSSSCGYCNDPRDTGRSHGMFARVLSVQAYQDLLDQGWRRSGTYLYKPNNRSTCCRQYTIRLPVLSFTPTRNQRRLLKRWDEFLAGTYEFPTGGAGPQDAMDIDTPTAAEAGAGTEAAAALATSAQETAGNGRNNKRSKTCASGAQDTPQLQQQQQQQQQPQPQQQQQGQHVQTCIGQEAQDRALLLQLLAAAMQEVCRLHGLPVHLLGLPQQQRQQQQEEEGGSVATTEVRVVLGPVKARPAAAADATYCSPVALPLAAAARKSGMHTTPQQLAQELAAAFNAGAASPAVAGEAGADVASSGGSSLPQASSSSRGCASVWHAAAAASGHLNFHCSCGPLPTGSSSSEAAALHAVSPLKACPDKQPRGASPAASSERQGQQQRRCQQQPQQQRQQQQQQQQQATAEPAHVFDIRMVPSQYLQEEFDLYCRYQMSQHGDSPEELTPRRYKNFLVETPLQPRPPTPCPPPGGAGAAVAGAAAAVEASAGGAIDIGVLAAARAAALQYVAPPSGAAANGSRPCSATSSSSGSGSSSQDGPASHAAPAAAAAAPVGSSTGAPGCGYGSCHMQYRLDGKLIAVGVVDALPRCLSSKYFFWDPDYAHLSLGRLSALLEIEWVKTAHAAGAPDLAYYYMGFYIHTCPKMRYKAEYQPSELLCPQRRVWVHITPPVLAALDASPYVVLSDVPGVTVSPNLVPGVSDWVTGDAAAPTAAAAGQQQAPMAAGGGSTGAGGASGDASGTGSSGSSSEGSDEELPAPGSPTAAGWHPPAGAAARQLLLLNGSRVVPWGVLQQMEVLGSRLQQSLQRRIVEWMRLVGPTSGTLLYQV